MYCLMDKVKSLIMNLMAHNYRSLTPAHKGPSQTTGFLVAKFKRLPFLDHFFCWLCGTVALLVLCFELKLPYSAIC